jgi:hypothetical protein
MKEQKKKSIGMQPDQEAIQSAFDTATSERFPHYAVQLPEWQNAPPVLKDNIGEEPVFNLSNHPLHCVTSLEPAIKALKAKYPGKADHVWADRNCESEVGEDDGSTISKVPHPGSDFSHVDPGVFNDIQKQGIQKAFKDLKALEGLVSQDGELDTAMRQVLPVLGKAEELLASKSKGMQRLKLVFEWVLCRVTSLFGEINAALDEPNRKLGQRAYEAARKSYIALLKDLDDHEPRTGSIAPGMSGYGRAVKWAYILPLIHGGRIKGAKVVAKWNPHISSSGIPIPHA